MVDTVLSGTYSKWVSADGRAKFIGDLGNIDSCYYPRPDYDDPLMEMQHVNAEARSLNRSRFMKGYTYQAMFPFPASSGPWLRDLVTQYPQKALDHSRRLIGPDDRPFLSMWRASDFLGSDLMKQFVFSKSRNDNDIWVRRASHFFKGRGVYILSPHMREGYLREMSQDFSEMRGTVYMDAVFEKHLWIPSIRFDLRCIIYGGPHGWSYNAPMEKIEGATMQYGVSSVLNVRNGINMDTRDVYGRPVSILDQTWEDARALIDVVGTKVRHNGDEHRFRYDTQAALLLYRFLFDHMHRNNLGQRHGDVHELVNQHYSSPQEMEAYELLKNHALGYIAEFCDTPTFAEIRKGDPWLERAWQELALPARKVLKTEAAIEQAILPYLPRGGYDNDTLRHKIERRRDPEKVTHSMNRAAQKESRFKVPVPLGQRGNPFACEYDSKIFNDREYARLGGTADPKYQDPDRDHETFEQKAARHVLTSLLADSRRSSSHPRTLLVLDNSGDGIHAAYYDQQHGVNNPKERKTAVDPLADGSEHFAVSAGSEGKTYIDNYVRALQFGSKHKDWRDTYGIGNIVQASTIDQAMGSFEGEREATNTPFHKAFAADGPMKNSSAASRVVKNRFIGQEANGVLLLNGALSEDSYSHIVQGVLANFGLIERAYEGGNYDFRFFIVSDYCQAEASYSDPYEMDLADIIIHIGLKVKADLEAAHPEAPRDSVLALARLLNLHERLVDPEAMNMMNERALKTGEDRHRTLINKSEINEEFIAYTAYGSRLPQFINDNEAPYRPDSRAYHSYFDDPEFIAFRDNRLNWQEYFEKPSKKTKLVEMLTAYMLYMPMPSHEAHIEAPVTGALRTRGIKNLSKDDVETDLDPEWVAARQWWHQQVAAQRADKIIANGLQVTYVDGPATMNYTR